jgi:hypothetical protein
MTASTLPRSTNSRRCLQDETAVRIRVGLRSNPNRFEGWAHVNGLAWHKLRLHIPENESLRRELVCRHYDLPFARHFAERTSDLLGRKYILREWYASVRRRVLPSLRSVPGLPCFARQNTGELQPLEAPTEQLLTHLSGRSLVFMGSKHG